ncbi:MAG: zf-HC2 domain-containing protein [Planctomycetes bacterium]|nr:zf-HC2 domain-containing protein [Planctomycetota bacterium]
MDERNREAPLACGDVDAIVRDALGPETDPADRAAIEAHVRGCPRCSRRYRGILLADRAAATAFRWARETFRPREDLPIERQEPFPPAPRGPVILARRPLNAILALVAIFVLCALALWLAFLAYRHLAATGRIGPDTAPARVTRARLIFVADAIARYRHERGSLPEASVVWEAIAAAGRDGKPFLDPGLASPGEAVRDGFGAPIRFSIVEKEPGVPLFRLISAGPNGIDESGGGDDLLLDER